MARPGAEARRAAVGLEVEVVLTSVSHLGEGVGRLGDDAGELAGMAVFVPGSLPGERATVALDDVQRRFARGRLLDLLEPAPERVEPPCPVAHACGGCDLQHVDVEAQLALKTRIVTDQLQRLGGVEQPPVEPCRAVGGALGYRRHGTVHRSADGAVGFFGRASSDVVAIDACPVLDERLSAGLGAAAASGADHVGLHAGDTDVALVLTPGAGPLQLPVGPPHLLATQPEGPAVALRGDGVLTTAVPTVDGDLDLRHHVSSFFQPSPAAAGAIVDTVLAPLGAIDGALAWDLYAGVGLLGLALARRGAQVVSVEGHGPAAAWARHNAEALGLTLTVDERDVRAFVRGATEPPQLVVLDPPRSGAGAAVVEGVCALRPPDVVVVACDAGALARDVRTFAAHGYALETAVPLDTFPMTRHVEVVAHLRG